MFYMFVINQARSLMMMAAMAIDNAERRSTATDC